MISLEPITTIDLIGIAQCVLIWYGLHTMRMASKDRDKALDNQRVALEELIKRTASQ